MPVPTYYPWERNELRIKNPDTSLYTGNVIGNISKEEQVSMVYSVGNEWIGKVRDAGADTIAGITTEMARYHRLSEIVDEVNDAVMNYFGE